MALLIRALVVMFIGMCGAYVGIVVAQSAFIAWWAGVITTGLVILIAEGA